MQICWRSWFGATGSELVGPGLEGNGPAWLQRAVVVYAVALAGMGILVGTGILAEPALAQSEGTRPVEGLRDNTPGDYVLTGARLVVRPGQVIERGSLVVRKGLIEQIGADLTPPAGLRVLDMSGKTIYAGFIDAYGEIAAGSDRRAGGAGYWNGLVQPERRVSDSYRADAAANAAYRSQGVTVRLLAPQDGIIKGFSALVSTSDEGPERSILASEVCQQMRLTVSRGRGRDDYPNSPMGAVALARQALYDAQWYGQAWAAHRADARQPRPERNEALEVLQRYGGGDRLVMIEASDELYLLRADRFAREFALPIVIRGSGSEYRRLDAVRATGRAVIVPLNFPKAPNVGTAEAALNVTLERLMQWDLAPENAARLQQAGVPIALTSFGLKQPKDMLPAVRKAVQRGLSPEAALAALTLTPARLFGMADRLGSLEAGKLANFVVADGDVFADKTKVLETWVGGRRYEIEKPADFDWRGSWRIKLEGGEKMSPLTLHLTGSPESLKGTVRLAQDAAGAESEAKLSRVTARDARLGTVFPAAKFGHEGFAQLTAVLSAQREDESEAVGHLVWPDGRRVPLTATRAASDSEQETSTKEPKAPASSSVESAKPNVAAGEDVSSDAGSKDESAKDESAKQPPRASFAVNFPLGAFGRAELPPQPQHVLLRGATVWTCGPQGILRQASVLVRQGVIVAVGTDVQAPPDTLIVDCTGKHLSPGIIDCHSHMATDGGINEATQTVTAEVRIGDFIDGNDIDIYRQLAGGVTTANILHGSANAIGGQNQVIKLRWGALPEAMKFHEAPPGIKFALGENVKQSNWGDEFTTRYPQSRMGVEQIMRDSFEAARQYAERWKQWRASPQDSPPRRDLELDAIAEILAGQRWIHCHSYRQDEILALIRTLDEYQVRIGTFQHILEGYKVADAMARHGAMGSSFSDWWAYKFEVYDAIPYNGALMHNAGVVVSFNSDDRELARHLNHEAAKATRYGGVPSDEALKFVTLNPARQLRIDQYVGSLEVGKHADLLVWSGPPLSTLSRCEQTWVDGRRYFDLLEDQQLRETRRQMRTALIQKILASGEAMLAPGEPDDAQKELWPQHDIFCHGHGHDHGHDHGHGQELRHAGDHRAAGSQ